MTRFDVMKLTDSGWLRAGNELYTDQFEAKEEMIRLIDQDENTLYGVMCMPGYSPVRSRMAYMLYRSDWERE